MTVRVLVLTPRFHPASAVGGVRWTALVGCLQDADDVEVGVICRRERGDGEDEAGRVILELGRPAGAGTDQGSSAPAAGGRGTGGGGTGWRARISTSTERARTLASLVAVPDTAALAWFSERAEVLAAARRFAPDVVVSTSPPHGLHLLGRWLSRRLGVRWIVDFRDPYVGDARYDRPRLRPWTAAHAAVEGSIVGRADVVLTAGASHAEDLRARYPDRAGRVVHLPNGFHPGARGEAAPVAVPADGPLDLAVVATAGIEELQVVVDAARRTWPDRRVRLCTIGLPEPQVADLRTRVDVVAHPWAAPEELSGLLADAAILLLVLTPERGAGGGTSTKLYQYIDAARPILAVNPTASDEVLLGDWARSAVVHRPGPEAASEALVALAGPGGGGIDLDDFRRTYGWPALAARLRTILVDGRSAA